MRLRSPRPGDGERLREIAIAAKGHWGYDQAQVLEWASQGDFSPTGLAAKTFLVAEDECRPIGFASLLERSETWILDDLWVDPPWIGCGVGSQLFAACVERARKAGAKRLELEAEPHAVGFYARMGTRYLRDSEPTEFGRVIPVMGLDLTT